MVIFCVYLVATTSNHKNTDFHEPVKYYTVNEHEGNSLLYLFFWIKNHYKKFLKKITCEINISEVLQFPFRKDKQYRFLSILVPPNLIILSSLQ